MGRAVLQQTVVIGIRRLTPTAIGVVAGLVRQHREIVLIEVDQAVRIFTQVFRPVHAKQSTQAWFSAGDRLALIASVSVTTRNGGPADDEFWRRPADGTPPPPELPPTSPPGPAYPGPPPSAPPPRGWRPPVVMQPAAPRELPPQDSTGIEEEERSARTLTYGIGMIAAAVLVVVVCLLCSRVLF